MDRKGAPMMLLLVDIREEEPHTLIQAKQFLELLGKCSLTYCQCKPWVLLRKQDLYQ